MAETSLLEFNQEGALSNMLAMEEHLAGQNTNGITINTWCYKKHGLLAKNHHMMEMKTLLSEEDPNKAKKLGEFMDKFSEVLNESNPTPSKVRDLRNEFREEIMNDQTLYQEKKKCGVCSLDRRNNADSHAMPPSNTNESNNTLLWVLGGVVVLGTVAYLALRKK